MENINNDELRNGKAGMAESISLKEQASEQANELLIANKKLLQNIEEREQKAAELVLANKELAMRIDENVKRAAELVAANEELAFQNREKERIAEELLVANKELLFQINEKEKRAAELIELTAQLQVANNELESFSYSVSHDLRAPLRAVHGYAKMLQRNVEGQLDSEATRMLNNILYNSKKMGQLIDELLSFSRLGRKELTMVNIDMKNMVTNICDELAIEKDNKHITFEVGELSPCRGDMVTIKQVWLNLISNAVKYCGLKDKANIRIESNLTNGEIVYHVTDNGAGFDMRYADKLFAVFQRLHSDEEFEGIGVGLAIVHRVIAKHDGRVWAEGKVNEGASFHFTL